MSWANQIEQWRQFAIWEGRDIPPDLLLSIIAHESGGRAGAQANISCKAGELPKMDGSTIEVNKALGLTQCIPAVIEGYNQNFPETAFYEDMIGDGERAARLQIRIGAWIYAANVRQLHNYDPVSFPGATPGRASPEQLKLALVAYAIGFGAKSGPGGKGLKPKLDELKARGLPLTLENIAAVFPNWGKRPDSETWINRPVHYARTVWGNYQKHGTGAAGASAPRNPRGLPDFPTIEKAAQKIKSDWPWLLIAAAVAYFWASSKKGGGILPIAVGKAKVIGRT